MTRCLHLRQAGPPCGAPLGPLWGALSNRMSSGAARLSTRVQRATLHNLHYAAVQLQRPLPAGWPQAVITVSSPSFFLLSPYIFSLCIPQLFPLSLPPIFFLISHFPSSLSSFLGILNPVSLSTGMCVWWCCHALRPLAACSGHAGFLLRMWWNSTRSSACKSPTMHCGRRHWG